MKTPSYLFCAPVCALLLGCTHIMAIRTEPPPEYGSAAASVPLPQPTTKSQTFLDCKTGSVTAGEKVPMLENYGDYLIGYAEFDDQGWAYDNDRQLEVLKRRINDEMRDPQYEKVDFLLMVFIHGWHHNAHYNDCNVQEFRQMVRLASEGTNAGGLAHRRRVIGIYVGWRGESVDAALLRYTTVIDRRNTAERVAKGSVRKLFADIHEEQAEAQKVRADKMRTVVIGHSFGGLIAFSALSEEFLNDLTFAALDSPHTCGSTEPKALGEGKTAVWPDGIILINPAFEASRFEPLHRLLEHRVACTPANTPPDKLVVPNLIVVTASNDHWTGKYFTAGRAVSTLFEGYDRTNPRATAAERESNLHAIGFVPAYQTHALNLVPQGAAFKAIATSLPAANGPSNFDTPVWVVTAPPSIVNGHNGFLYARLDSKNPQPYLANWLLELYLKDCAAAPDVVNCHVEARQ